MKSKLALIAAMSMALAGVQTASKKVYVPETISPEELKERQRQAHDKLQKQRGHKRYHDGNGNTVWALNESSAKKKLKTQKVMLA